ncbi:hypothetical protein IF2G_03559 [Cordyceps javanica]|nr:hypothetical protein IF2G_03559 [Cordyceps javanica]
MAPRLICACHPSATECLPSLLPVCRYPYSVHIHVSIRNTYKASEDCCLLRSSARQAFFHAQS